MKFIETIHQCLSQCTASISLLGANRIFHSFVPATQSMPYAVITSVNSSAVANTLQCDNTLRVATFSISCVATTIGQAAGICNQFHVELEGALGSTANLMKVQRIRIEDETFQWDPGDDANEAGAFVCVLNVRMYYITEQPLPISLQPGN